MVMSPEFLLLSCFSFGFLNTLPSWEARALKKKTGGKKEKKKHQKKPEVASKFTHKVISMFKHFAELTSAIRALARTVSYFMYEL